MLRHGDVEGAGQGRRTQFNPLGSSACSRSLILRRGSYLTLLSPCALPYTMFPRWALHLVLGVARVGGEEVGFRKTREGPARDAPPWDESCDSCLSLPRPDEEVSKEYVNTAIHKDHALRFMCIHRYPKHIKNILIFCYLALNYKN